MINIRYFNLLPDTMNKIFNLGAIVALILSSTGPAMAVESIVKGASLNAISADGVWVAGVIGSGDILIRNLSTGQDYTSFTDGAQTNYGIGQGSNPISNTGVVTGTTTFNNAAYWEAGEWHELPTPNANYISNAMSITPDGSRICGGVGGAAFAGDDTGIMLLPAIWQRQSNGTYGEPIILPHPEYDYTGRKPQYITAVTISADGKTVGGLVRDNSGFMEEPIVYRQDDSGNWSYSLLYPQLINPKGVSFPPYPGSFDISAPDKEEFMTPEELDAYQREIDANRSPNPDDYLTPSELLDFTAAYNDWVTKYNDWAKKYLAFEEAYNASRREGFMFVFNNAALSANGKYFVTTREISYVEDPLDGPKSRFCPVLMNVDGSGYTELNGTENDLSLMMSGVALDGSVLANYRDPYELLPRRAYIFPPNTTAAMPLEDYIAPTNPQVADWMRENMTHEVYTAYNRTENYMCSGVPIGTPDLSTMICFVEAETWVETTDDYYYSYIFNTGLSVYVDKVIEESDSRISVDGNGMISLKGDFVSLRIYDTAGHNLLNFTNPSGTISTGLNNGLYIIVATTSEGQTFNMKSIF